MTPKGSASNSYAPSGMNDIVKIGLSQTWTGRQRSVLAGKILSIYLLGWVQFPELSVASYNKNAAAVNEPDGIVAVWNLHLLERPEFVFHSQVYNSPWLRI
jgi:hypothetical protein